MIKTRFAPSPTGFLHIGAARTALFSWVFARKNNGEFLLRIEDTDRVRSKDEYVEEIISSLKWLGLGWSEVIYQSKRFEIYRDYAHKLIESGKAYEKDGAVFFKYVFSQVEIDDLIRGRIVFKELPKSEDVIIKSDGSPTYNFCCVIDDALGGITHIIRGEDHIPNTPKQLLLYKAMGFKIPKFAHLPMILSSGGGKMSKRFGATSIKEYKDKGYLSAAIANYLLLLGWSPGANREIISLDEAIELFDIKDVNKTSAAFSMDKLNWINSEYIKKMDIDELTEYARVYLKDKNFLPQESPLDYLKKVVELFKGRINKLGDLCEWAYFCFYDDYSYAPDTGNILDKNLSREISILKDRIYNIESFDKETIESEFRSVAKELGLKARDLVHPVRVALTGRRIGPGLFETIEVLGREKVVERLKRLAGYWKKEA